MSYDGGCSSMPIHEVTYSVLKNMYAHKYWPICQAKGELIISYHVILFSSHAFHFATLKHT